MTWPDLLQHVRDVLLHTFQEADLVSYEPADGQPALSVRVAFHAPDREVQTEEGVITVQGQETQCFVTKEDLDPWIPQEGDKVTIGGVRYVVQGGVEQPGGRGLYRLPLFEETP